MMPSPFPRLLRSLLPAMAACALISAAGEPPAPPPQPPKIELQTFRPFADVPEVLLFDNFEGEKSSFGDNIKAGAGTMGSAAVKAKLLNPADAKNKDWAVGSTLNLAQVRIPSGIKPDQIFVQFMVYVEKIEGVRIQLALGVPGRSTFADVLGTPLKMDKQWVLQTASFADLKTGDKNVKPARLLTEDVGNVLQVRFLLKEANKDFVGYVDDFVVTVGVKPAMILPRIVMGQKKLGDINRSISKDGYAYSIPMQEALHAALKPATRKTKSKVVLVAAPKTGDADVAKTFSAAATKNKVAGVQFLPLTFPDNTPATTIDDIRLLTAYNLEKSGAETVVIVINPSEVAAGDPSKLINDNVRVLMSRIIEMGSVPIFCMPATSTTGMNGDQIKKIEKFNELLGAVCAQAGIPHLSATAALKAAPAAFEKMEYSAAGLEGIAALATQAVRHVEVNYFARK